MGFLLEIESNWETSGCGDCLTCRVLQKAFFKTERSLYIESYLSVSFCWKLPHPGLWAKLISNGFSNASNISWLKRVLSLDCLLCFFMLELLVNSLFCNFVCLPCVFPFGSVAWVLSSLACKHSPSVFLLLPTGKHAHEFKAFPA